MLARSEQGQFDSGSLPTCATPIVLEDEIRFYYGGYSAGATSGDDYSLTTGVGFASIRRDRFAGVVPVEKSAQASLKKPLEHIGQVTMKPIDLGAFRQLTINADAGAGSIRVELLNEEGRRIRGFSREDAVAIQGDALRHPVRWTGQAEGSLPPGRVLIRLHLERATVYAVTLSP